MAEAGASITAGKLASSRLALSSAECKCIAHEYISLGVKCLCEFECVSVYDF